MKQSRIISVLTGVFYCLSIFRIITDYGGKKIMEPFIYVFNYYCSNPWDIIGFPFLVVAVILNIYIVYFKIKERKRAQRRKAQQVVEMEMKRTIREGRAQAAIITALNECREKLNLPPIHMY